jgi:hypothetical protein
MEKPAHEWRDIVAHCAETGQQGLRDLIRPHLVGRADDEAVVIRAPLTIVGQVTTIVEGLEPTDRHVASAGVPDPVAVAAGTDRGAVALEISIAGERRPIHVALTRDQARKTARAILAITDPGQ